ncbi:MarR family winged helix-turn-helix transcriptional regulator [Brevibacillus dissolubilis]|uniref:MarR family winged helix-turn-helix transcriptional regulator n=1 Tax=Brevibacillus dissolubilis TaxID=1844116 RepID=UPI0011170815|nr:MarR family transcriptional regulator [Brevibacillus dissolubilis]
MADERNQHICDLDCAMFELGRYFVNQWLSQESELTSKQLILLRTLYENGRCTVTDLANALRLSSSATTIALNKMVKSGYINRIRDENDRRVVWVELSEAGLEGVQSAIEKRRIVLQKAMRSLTSEQIQVMVQTLRQMNSNLENF